MLCDFLFEQKWFTDADWDQQFVSPLTNRPLHGQELRSTIDEVSSWDANKIAERHDQISALYTCMRRMQEFKGEVLARRRLHMTSTSGLQPDTETIFKDLVSKAHKFKLSTQFTTNTMERLATPETVQKSKQFFRLAHDPMWMEWRHEVAPDVTIGALVQTAGTEGSGAYSAHLVLSLNGLCMHKEVRFYPETMRLNDGRLEFDVTQVDGSPLTSELMRSGVHDDDTLTETLKIVELSLRFLVDFVIRINSPRITSIGEPVDVSTINKKRVRNGKLPLFSYQVVDLSQDVKDGLRQPCGEAIDGVRLHWRRGHFKARKTGLFWWNPHTAGRKELGVIAKEYAA